VVQLRAADAGTEARGLRRSQADTAQARRICAAIPPM
jgi:hypothetical protein